MREEVGHSNSSTIRCLSHAQPRGGKSKLDLKPDWGELVAGHKSDWVSLLELFWGEQRNTLKGEKNELCYVLNLLIKLVFEWSVTLYNKH